MHDVPQPRRHRRGVRHESELGRSGLLGSAVATDATHPDARRDPPRPWRPEARPSDALTAECTCPDGCIHDHEHE